MVNIQNLLEFVRKIRIRARLKDYSMRIKCHLVARATEKGHGVEGTGGELTGLMSIIEEREFMVWFARVYGG